MATMECIMYDTLMHMYTYISVAGWDSTGQVQPLGRLTFDWSPIWGHWVPSCNYSCQPTH